MPAPQGTIVPINRYNRQTPETFSQPGSGGSSKTLKPSGQSEPLESHSNKRKSNWSCHKQKKHKKFVLEAGMKGFLCTCNFQEKHCIRDAYRILNEFSDKSEGDENLQVKGKNSQVKTKNLQIEAENSQLESEDLQVDVTGPEEEISTILSRELQQLRAEGESPAEDRKFQAVETSVRNALFIQSTVPDPLKLAMSIINDVYRTQKQRSKFVLRLLPVEIVTKANLDDLKTAANTVLEKYFSQEPKTFSIIFNRHSNSNLERNKVIDELGIIIARKNPGNRANLKNPEISVIVEVIRGFCLLSIAPNYFMYKKYNLLEMCKKTVCPLKQLKKKEKQEKKELEEQEEKELEEQAEKIRQKFIKQQEHIKQKEDNKQEEPIKPHNIAEALATLGSRFTDSSPNLYPHESPNRTSDQPAGGFSRDSIDFLTITPSPLFPASDYNRYADVPPRGHAEVPPQEFVNVPPNVFSNRPCRGNDGIPLPPLNVPPPQFPTVPSPGYPPNYADGNLYRNERGVFHSVDMPPPRIADGQIVSHINVVPSGHIPVHVNVTPSQQDNMTPRGNHPETYPHPQT